MYNKHLDEDKHLTINERMDVPSSKSAIISIIGKPNVGKSTLLNRIIGQKISIVTPKAQTTRNVINGITTINNVQLIFLDTPGIFDAKRAVDQHIVRQAWSSINGADFVIIMLDTSYKVTDSTIKILERVAAQGLRTIIVINKVDVKNSNLIEILKYFVNNPHISKVPIFQISALNGDGVELLMNYLVNHAPLSPWNYEIDDITTLPMRFLATEITREQLFLKLQQELPYNLTVSNEKWENFDNGSVKIHQVINVATAAHKKMIVGKRGAMIQAIGSASRQQFEAIYGIQAHLFLFVRVQAGFLDNPNAFSRID